MSELATTTTVERELKSIWDARGSLTPAEVVEAARPANHPLHAAFEWDDKVAGDAYRCLQAAQLIRSVKIKILAQDESEHRVRAWLPASYTGATDDALRGSYVPTQSIESDEQRQLLLRRMRSDAAAFRRRYSHLREFWEVIGELSQPDA